MNLSEFEDAYEDTLNVEDAILATPISELMAHRPLIVDAEMNVVDAVDAMNVQHIGCVLVEKAGKLVGIFTERDVLRRVIFQEGNRSWTVEAVMTPNPSTLPPNASIAFALNKMSVDGYRHIPVVNEDGKAIGVISIKDIVGMMVEAFPHHILNLPPDPERAYPSTDDGA